MDPVLIVVGTIVLSITGYAIALLIEGFVEDSDRLMMVISTRMFLLQLWLVIGVFALVIPHKKEHAPT